jgi:hypothetical protein
MGFNQLLIMRYGLHLLLILHVDGMSYIDLEDLMLSAYLIAFVKQFLDTLIVF